MELRPIFKEGLSYPQSKNKYIITGGPGVGKTELLLGLGRLGFATFPEAARDIIERYQDTHPEYMPWTNRKKFDELLLEQFIQMYNAHNVRMPA